MKSIFVQDLRQGARINDVFLVGEKRVGQSTNGAPYVHLVLRDRTGSIKAVKWEADMSEFDRIGQGDYVEANGVVTTYKNALQIRLDQCHKYDGEVDYSDFLPKTTKNVDEMMASVMSLVESVRHPQLRQLLDRLFGDPSFRDAFKSAPAARSVHHAYIGGLIEHTLSVAKLCKSIASNYPNMNRDLLVAGALLHDIGKTEEIVWETSIDYTDVGHFIGHVVAGAMKVESAIREIPDFDPDLRMEFLHLMLSHHGLREFGAPVLPSTREAIALHYIEDMDAKVNMFENAVAAPGDERWTGFHSKLERNLYRGPSASDKLGKPLPAEDDDLEDS